jgi:AcrR family transcriptional regulator
VAPESVSTKASSTAGSADPSRRQRSDARQNVLALVQAAKAVFADRGVDAPAKEITDRAGVGVGTLYRHFPRRSDLIVAVMQHEIDDCIDAAAALGSALSPWDALLGWTERLLNQLEPTLRTLLARAVAGGYAREDVTAREILATVALICQPVPGEQPGFNQRMTRVFMQGLAMSAKAGVEPVAGPAARRG